MCQELMQECTLCRPSDKDACVRLGSMLTKGVNAALQTGSHDKVPEPHSKVDDAILEVQLLLHLRQNVMYKYFVRFHQHHLNVLPLDTTFEYLKT